MKRIPCSCLLLYCFCFFAGGGLHAQTIQLSPSYPEVTTASGPLELAWFGGLNTPQPQTADLDGDGTDDLYVFDKAGEIHLSLRGLGGDSYNEAPELVAHFPEEIREWVMIRDYNLDDIPDIFTYASAVDGIAVYRGRRRVDGLLEFDLVNFGNPLPQLYFPFEGRPSPIFVSSIDYPAIDDIDFDGDLDILTFSVGGGYVEYYRNMGVERGFGADTLLYELADQCWGGFFESGLSPALDLGSGPGDCFNNLLGPGGGGRPRHSGSTLLTLDYNGNGLSDIMLGDISFDGLVLGFNNGSREQAWISAQDSVWKEDGVEADIPSFPAGFHLDVDQDGARDLVASPSVTLNGTDVEVMWYYRNVGSDAEPEFVLQKKTLLVDEMIDVGTSANVTTFDYDADGRPDLVVGNNDEFTGTNFLDSRLRLFRNVTPSGGAITFELVSEDYLGLSAFMTTSWGYAPAFGDLDGDGDEDVIIGERSGKIVFGENTAGAGREATFAPLQFEWLGIDAGQFSKPALADLDRDGLLDILLGGFDGRIRFYRNIGTATEPAFDPSTSAAGNVLQLGGINTNAPGVSTGHPTPAVVQNDDFTLVISGNRSGTIEVYRFGADSAYTEPFTLLTKTVDSLDLGAFTNPALADFDGDRVLEMVVGNERGGISFYETDLRNDLSTGLFSAVRPAFDFSVFPNPVADELTISGLPAGVREVALLDVQGRVLRSTTLQTTAYNLPSTHAAQTQVQWRLKELSAGVYFVRASGPEGVATRRVVHL